MPDRSAPEVHVYVGRLFKNSEDRGTTSTHGGINSAELVELLIDLADGRMFDEDRFFEIIHEYLPPLRHRLPTLLQPANSTGPAAGNVVTLAERVKPPR